MYQGVPIAYSLGNFVFSPARGACSESAILWVDLRGGRARQVKVIPVRIHGWQPREAIGADARAILKRVSRLSDRLGTQGEVRGDPLRWYCRMPDESEQAACKPPRLHNDRRTGQVGA